MTWHVWTDGSCQHGTPTVPKRTPGWGGWCAIVEHGSDGELLSGRVEKTTNVRMEIQAAVEGLRRVPADASVVLHTDCTTILCVRDAWRDGKLDDLNGPDIRMWRQLGAELDRIESVTVRLVVRGYPDKTHRRAHGVAGAQARGGVRNLPENAVPLDDGHHIREGMRRELAASWRTEQEDRRLAYRALARRTWRDGVRSQP